MKPTRSKTKIPHASKWRCIIAVDDVVTFYKLDCTGSLINKFPNSKFRNLNIEMGKITSNQQTAEGYSSANASSGDSSPGGFSTPEASSSPESAISASNIASPIAFSSLPSDPIPSLPPAPSFSPDLILGTNDENSPDLSTTEAFDASSLSYNPVFGKPSLPNSFNLLSSDENLSDDDFISSIDIDTMFY